MKSPLKKRFIFIGGGTLLIIGFFIFLFFDAFYGGNNFRTMQDAIPSEEQVDLTGLRELQASGGNAPRFMDLQKRLSDIKKNKIIIDVKCEPHGYINSVPTTFLGYGHPKPGLRHLPRRFFLTGTIYERQDLVIPESEEAKKYGFNYKTVNIGSKFTAVDENIDEIVNLFDSLSEDDWVHIHCTNGKGRTSMVLAMLDIMRNAPTVSLDNIIKRQHLLGSVNLYNTTQWRKGSTYTTKQLEARKKFIEDFYKFICQRKEGGIHKWSDWNQQKNQQARL